MQITSAEVENICNQFYSWKKKPKGVGSEKSGKKSSGKKSKKGDLAESMEIQSKYKLPPITSYKILKMPQTTKAQKKKKDKKINLKKFLGKKVNADDSERILKHLT